MHKILNNIVAFFIGSIQQVNKKISRLDHKLQRYTQLVVESRASDVVDTDLVSVDSTRGKDRYEKRGSVIDLLLAI